MHQNIYSSHFAHFVVHWTEIFQITVIIIKCYDCKKFYVWQYLFGKWRITIYRSDTVCVAWKHALAPWILYYPFSLVTSIVMMMSLNIITWLFLSFFIQRFTIHRTQNNDNNVDICNCDSMRIFRLFNASFRFYAWWTNNINPEFIKLEKMQLMKTTLSCHFIFVVKWLSQ